MSGKVHVVTISAPADLIDLVERRHARKVASHPVTMTGVGTVAKDDKPLWIDFDTPLNIAQDDLVKLRFVEGAEVKLINVAVEDRPVE